MFLSVKEDVTVRTEGVPSQGSKRNIEIIINTHTCKVSMAFLFFPQFFSAVERRELEGFFILSIFVHVWPSESCILLNLNLLAVGSNMICWCLCTLYKLPM